MYYNLIDYIKIKDKEKCVSFIKDKFLLKKMKIMKTN